MVKVLISGAGAAGLSLALRLRQRGMAPVVVERSPRLRDGGGLLGLSDPGLDTAERRGVADAPRAAFPPGRGWRPRRGYRVVKRVKEAKKQAPRPSS